ncbi:MAG: nucleotide exchange factor GrpE [Methylococcales bacterium]|nr:MAG: nucleotide exchange factor GrpE [Methylococcales bacterium]
MSIDQEKPDEVISAETEVASEIVNEEQPHTEVAEHEYTIEELKKELEEAKQKNHETWDKAVRIQAEMENLKRRTQKDLEDAHKFTLTNFGKALLPVFDSVVLGLQAATGESEEVKKFREGSELTIKQFEALFEKFNILAIDPIGQPFSAEFHQAVLVQAAEDAEPNTVINVFQKGYTLNGRLLRPAMVVVAKAPEKPSEDNTQA